MTTPILITGASGYIGGTVLSTILASSKAKSYDISALVRSEEQANILEQKGIKPIVFKGLDDLDVIRRSAAENDVVIHTASASEEPAAKALIQGLGERRKKINKDVHMIHTSGTSILGDHAAGNATTNKIFSDVDDMYTWEKEFPEPYDQRIVDVSVFENGIAENVKTYIISPPTIYGPGTGWFSQLTQQIPNFTKLAVGEGETKVIGEGKSTWNHVEVVDLSHLYELILRKVVSGENVPSNKEGYYFAQSGEHSWREASDGIAKALKKQGVLKTDSVSSITPEEVAKKFGLTKAKTEIVLCSNSRCEDNRSRSLGWTPTHSNEHFYGHFDGEVQATLKSMGK